MKRSSIIFPAFSLFVLLLGCKSTTSQKQVINLDSINMSSTNQPVNPLDSAGKGLPIFYNMYLSVDLSSLFQTAGAVFKPELMNEPDRMSEYMTSTQQAINLGVYAVDLCYSRVFDQGETAGRYFSAMRHMAHELGIPDDYFEKTTQRFEKNLSNKDSLIAIANEVYVTTNNYLKKNERYTTSAMIILGGWVEAIHIAIDVAVESRNPDIIDKLVDQKYSLNNLMIMLSERKNSDVVLAYLRELLKIKKEFDDIEVPFDTSFDPNSKKGKEQIDIVVQHIQTFGKTLNAFRDQLVK